MTSRVVVWGTGNVGRPAIRAVLASSDLELVGVIVSNPNKVGIDAGALAGVAATGIIASDDAAAVLAGMPDAVAYCGSGDFRPQDATADIEQCLRAGVNVVTTALYDLLHPPTTPEPLRSRIADACAAGNSSVFVTGIDPGWALDLLPLVLSGVAGEIEEIRAQEIFCYETYHAPDAVRYLIGFGQPMDELPIMLDHNVLLSIWGGMIRVVADGLGLVVDDITTSVERFALEETVEVPGMGTFEAGSQGAFRFEVQGIVGGRPRIVMEHVTRLVPGTSPHLPSAPNGRLGCHRVIVSGRPSITVTIEADDGTGNPAEGGNATAAGRMVHAIPAVCAAAAGAIHPLDLPLVIGRGVRA
ncbi:MAG: 4-hydroxy-tetrahydrodipicolinate reductase [Ilumatobacteraceae bacterium]|nr:4-hydroxy-tetrahydrodipicolinate reductase [Ilumatobacteraceae bacterium]